MDDRKYLENIGTLIENSMINKVNEFEQSVMKIINLMIHMS